MVANAGVGVPKPTTVAEGVLMTSQSYYKPISVLNSYLTMPSSRPADLSAWDALWAVNIRGVVLCYKYAAQYMIKQGIGGRIIGMTRIWVCLLLLIQVASRRCLFYLWSQG
jgi:NAD(P)-dependent dehydrogenase (short-subunit alcohol dehydrogenase family)